MSRQRINRAVAEEKARNEFKAEIRRQRAGYEIRQSDIACELGIKGPMMSVLFSNPDKFTVERLRIVISMLHLDPKVVLCFLGYSEKEIKQMVS